jgi:hypothetical protein
MFTTFLPDSTFPIHPIKRPEKKKFMNISNSKRHVKVLTRPVLQTLLELKCVVSMTPKVSLIPHIKTNEASSTGPSFHIYTNQFLQQNVTFPPFFRKTDKRFKWRQKRATLPIGEQYTHIFLGKRTQAFNYTEIHQCFVFWCLMQALNAKKRAHLLPTWDWRRTL